MKKTTHIVNITTETILGFVLVGIIAISFLATNNLSSIKPIEVKNPVVLGATKYENTFNPSYISDEFITIKDGGLGAGGANLNIDINSRKNEETIKLMTIYNNESFKLDINVVLDFVELDKNANYTLLVNDSEQMVKDSFKPEQSNVIINIEPENEAVISIKIKSLERIKTNFNIIFSEY